MKNLLIPFFFCLVGTGCTVEQDNEKGNSETVSAAQNGTPPDKVREASELMSQVNVHIQNQQYLQALTDAEAALALAPDHAENRFLYCMLRERADESFSRSKDCYAQVVKLLSPNGDTPCEANLNCVVADLMAEGDHASERKEHFLSLPASEVESEVHHFLLDDFERGRYLRTILP
mgnify:FL=1